MEFFFHILQSLYGETGVISNHWSPIVNNRIHRQKNLSAFKYFVYYLINWIEFREKNSIFHGIDEICCKLVFVVKYIFFCRNVNFWRILMCLFNSFPRKLSIIGSVRFNIYWDVIVWEITHNLHSFNMRKFIKKIEDFFPVATVIWKLLLTKRPFNVVVISYFDLNWFRL